jgi:RNA polymerase-binding protein DksA
MLDAQFIEHNKQVLLQERETLLGDIEALKQTLKSEVDVDVEEGDPEIIEREKSATLLETLEAKLAAVDHALKIIDAGQYGVCERCGAEIPQERLEVKPEATLCVKCQSEVERMLRRGMNPQRTRWHFPVE